MPPDIRKNPSDQKTMKEIIHSGHFMVSDIDDPEVQDGDDNPSLVVHESDCDQESLPLPATGFDFESACKETSKTYTFGSRSSHSISIDASLTKLFECMTLAYRFVLYCILCLSLIFSCDFLSYYREVSNDFFFISKRGNVL